VTPAGTLWEQAPCGLLQLGPDGSVLEANATLLAWAGRDRGDVVGRRVTELLTAGGRIYWETHLAPLLPVAGRFDEVALELRGPGGRMPVLMTAVVSGDVVRVALSSARDRAGYERELLAARADAERAAAQLDALQHVTAALSRAVGVDAVADALVAAATGALGAASAGLWLTQGDGGLVRHRGSVALPVLAEPTGAVLGSGDAVVQAGDRADVPLQGQDALRGVLSLLADDGPAADPLDLEVLTAVGRQAGLALDRASLYEQSASVARELQHSLLAVEPPADARFHVSTAYRPGVEALEVGGDWYDVFLVEDGVLAVVVGDVVGRGLPAATAMGQLRSAVRAVAGPGVGPAALLSRLDRFVDQVEAASMATLAYAELDLATGLLRYACAGHPPPALLPAEGLSRLVWDGRSTPLGAFTRPEPRSEAAVQLQPGDRVLLYTDGLVERRDRALDDSLARLLSAAVALQGRPLDTVVSELTTQLLRDEQGRDDVCVLLLSWAGTSFERRLDADLTGLSAARLALGTWLVDQGADEGTCRDVVLAASEAVANAAEHGLAGAPGAVVEMEVHLERQLGAPAEVVVSVADAGEWRAPAVRLERGRGLTIMRALVDDLAVETGPGTRVVLRRRLQGRAS
jgi:serine phosphatase RsbU (regulator of sigma subunit)/anti-sigma regulatory factor (Ser/Thr protein kinase)